MRQTDFHQADGLRRPDDDALKSSARWFVGLFAAFVASAGVVGHLTLPGSLPMEVARAEDPPSGYYLAHGRSGHTDHHVLYHGLDEVSNDRLDSAEVLWLGNSRLLFALNRQALRRFFTPRGLSYFVLGFGHDETFHFPADILHRRGLRPKVVVVNVDEFFTGPPSEWAAQVVSDTRFDAWKWWFETQTSHVARQLLHQWIPHWPDLLGNRREFVVYRSQLDGTWWVSTWRTDVGPLPVSMDTSPPTAQRVANAQAFVGRMKELGASVIFCLVPGPRTSRATAELLAAEAGVPLVAPELDAPLTIDGSHLAEKSAEQYASLLLDALAPHFDQMGFSPNGSGYLMLPD